MSVLPTGQLPSPVFLCVCGVRLTSAILSCFLLYLFTFLKIGSLTKRGTLPFSSFGWPVNSKDLSGVYRHIFFLKITCVLGVELNSSCILSNHLTNPAPGFSISLDQVGSQQESPSSMEMRKL